jgi:hypothetical protein
MAVTSVRPESGASAEMIAIITSVQLRSDASAITTKFSSPSSAAISLR